MAKMYVYMSSYMGTCIYVCMFLMGDEGSSC